jgi:hypothetical protein
LAVRNGFLIEECCGTAFTQLGMSPNKIRQKIGLSQRLHRGDTVCA